MRNAIYWTVTILVTVAVLLGALAFGTDRTIQVIALCTLPVAVAFIWLYATDGWYYTWFGRSLMLLAVAVLAYTVAAALLRTLGEFELRGALLVFATGGTFLAMLIRTMVLWNVRKSDQYRNLNRKTTSHG